MQNSQNSLTKLVGNNIARRRKELGLTQEALAERVGVGQQSLSRIEHGRMAPKFERLQMFADALDWTVLDLFRSETQNLHVKSDRMLCLLSELEDGQAEFVLDHLAGLVGILKSK